MASKRSVQGAAPLLNPCSALVTATVPHLPDRVGSGRLQIGNLPYPGLLRVLENCSIRLERGFWLFCSEEGSAFRLVALFESSMCARAASIGCVRIKGAEWI